MREKILGKQIVNSISNLNETNQTLKAYLEYTDYVNRVTKLLAWQERERRGFEFPQTWHTINYHPTKLTNLTLKLRLIFHTSNIDQIKRWDRWSSIKNVDYASLKARLLKLFGHLSPESRFVDTLIQCALLETWPRKEHTVELKRRLAFTKTYITDIELDTPAPVAKVIVNGVDTKVRLYKEITLSYKYIPDEFQKKPLNFTWKK